MDRFINLILDLVFPKLCFGCGSAGSYLCDNCRGQIRRQDFQRCIVCQKPSLEGITHPKCKTANAPDRLTSLYDYRAFPVGEMIICGKYNFIPEIYKVLGSELSQLIKMEKHYEIIPVPLSASKLRWRGFNQTELLATQIASSHDKPISPMLTKVKNTKVQKDLAQQDRKQNVAGAFTTDFLSDIPQNVILVDDVVTTGSTFIEASRCLKNAGVKYVWCVALAQD